MLQADGLVELRIVCAKPSPLTMSYPATWVWQVSMQAPTGTMLAQVLNQLGDLLEAAAERELRARGVLDKHSQAVTPQTESFSRTLNGLGGMFKSLFAGEPAI